MQLNERIVEKAEIIRDSSIPKGILARVWYPIMRFGVKNANKRKYTKQVAETVLKDSGVKHKLETRTLFGNQEHPELSQIKLDWKETSHVISEFKLDENIFYAAFDILPSEPGKFIHGLLEAGCLVGVSTRADGELEECLDEDGSSYQNVVPRSYKFQTVDFTGDPSTVNALPEKIINSVKTRYESKDLDRGTAVALLEYVNTPESRQLMESVLHEDSHVSCACTPTAEGHVITCECKTPVKEVVVETKKDLKVGSFVKVNEKSGVVAHVFPRTKKAIVQFTDTKETVKLTECKLVEDSTTAGMDASARKLFGKPYSDLSFEEKEQVLDAPTDAQQAVKPEAVSPTPPAAAEPPIVPPVEQIPPTAGVPAKGFYKDEKGELLFIEPTADNSVKVVRQDGTESVLSVEEFNALRTTKSPEVTEKSLVGNVTEAKEYFVMRNEIREAIDARKKFPEEQEDEEKKEVPEVKGEIEESRLEQYVTDNWDSFLDSKDAITNMTSIFKISETKATETLQKCQESGKLQFKSPVTVETIREHYALDAIKYAKNLAELKETIRLLQEENKTYLGIEERFSEQSLIIEGLNANIKSLVEQKNENFAVVEKNAKTVETVSKELNEVKSENQTYAARITEGEQRLKELDENLKAANDTLKVSEATIKELNTKIKNLKESHKRDLIKIVVESKVSGLGLKLPKTTLALLEACNTVDEVNAMIRQTQDAIREGITHSVNISEIKIADLGTQPANPVQLRIDRQIENALKGFGV